MEDEIKKLLNDIKLLLIDVEIPTKGMGNNIIYRIAELINIYRVNMNWEICEDTGNVIHIHIDCPICNKANSPTNHYDELNMDDKFKCENCHSEFIYLGDNKVQYIDQER